MKILGIDTTTKFLCIGIYDDAGIPRGPKIYEYNLEVSRGLSVLLAQTIKRILDALRWRVSDIDYFACGLGPGSFTGIRLGLAAIKGLSWPVNKPVIGIPTLDILARNAAGVDKLVIPAIDAKRNLIYCSVYKNKDGMARRLKPYMLLSPEEFLKCAKPGSIILGDAVGLYKEDILRNIKGAGILDKDHWYPKARHIIELSLERIKERQFDSPLDIKPIYLYPKECQINKRKV
ncbi:MAG: tRNA (adenosine(37)-N6)-threonylcarbamoyltransferase complex dimerization subunit type 1 TsaB [Candidatus Omnitrophota bacterium]